jgi:hypothetical protein
MLKKNSEAWQLAKKLTRRKYCNHIPIELLPNDNVVMKSIIRGNTWIVTFSELKVKANANK